MKKKDLKKLNISKKVIASPTTATNKRNVGQELKEELRTWERPPCKYYSQLCKKDKLIFDTKA